MLIGAISYSIAAAIFLVLLLILLAGRTGGLPKHLLTFAVAASALWAAGAAYQAVFDAPLIIPQLLELLRDFAWLTFLMHMLSTKDGGKDAVSTSLAIARHGIYAFTAVMVALVLYLHFSGAGIFFLAGFDFQLAGHLLLAVIGLVLLEQVLRNTPSDLLRAIKYLCF